ncbi:hypothetical protein PoB_003624900 [Plakobranchus ocellatus]|uniref:Uncharacterized protein n=1 Tax=Plakobranchus ocellatus TaxID=259542 RepID=A0AAV4ATS5_9GAST|nr:hypothetical protein PoB_003624900 [Plakobranchus ocellatus]
MNPFPLYGQSMYLGFGLALTVPMQQQLPSTSGRPNHQAILADILTSELQQRLHGSAQAARACWHLSCQRSA